MRFRFSLQKVVDLKGNQKTQAEWMLSEAIGKLREEQLSLAELHQEKQTSQEQLRLSAAQPTAIVQLQLLQQYIDHLENLIERKNADLAAAQMNVDGKQQVLLEKTIDEKVWLKAREKAYVQFQAFSQKKEQEQLDEMVSNRHGIQLQ